MPHAQDESKVSTAALGRYLTGESSAGDVERVREWMGRTPLARAVVGMLTRYRANPTVPECQTDADALWRRIRERIVEGGDRANAVAVPGGVENRGSRRDGRGVRRVTHKIRDWFAGSIERAVAMLLDVHTSELSDEEEQRLRERIERAGRAPFER